jgi:hypothetical protein
MGMGCTRKNSVDGNPVVYHLDHYEQGIRSTTVERKRSVALSTTVIAESFFYDGPLIAHHKGTAAFLLEVIYALHGARIGYEIRAQFLKNSATSWTHICAAVGL